VLQNDEFFCIAGRGDHCLELPVVLGGVPQTVGSLVFFLVSQTNQSRHCVDAREVLCLFSEGDRQTTIHLVADPRYTRKVYQCQSP